MTDIRPNCQTIIDGSALPLVGSHYLWGATSPRPFLLRQSPESKGGQAIIYG
jgi:hypothetical protein